MTTATMTRPAAQKPVHVGPKYYGLLVGKMGDWLHNDTIPESWFLSWGHDIDRMLEQGVIFGPTGGPCNRPELLVGPKPKTAVDSSPALEAEVGRLQTENARLAADNARMELQAQNHAAEIQARDEAVGRGEAEITRLHGLVGQHEAEAERLRGELIAQQAKTVRDQAEAARQFEEQLTALTRPPETGHDKPGSKR